MKKLIESIQNYFKKLKEMNAREKAFFYAKVLGLIFVTFLLIGLFASFNVNKPAVNSNPMLKMIPSKESDKNKSNNSSFLLGDDLDQKSYVQKMETQYYAVTEKNQNLEQKVSDLSSQLDKLAKSQAQLNETVGSLDTKISDSVTKIIETTQLQKTSSINNQDYQLEITKISDLKVQDKKGVYLPVGSFVRGTLLTGVYAPSDQSNPLPVLIRLKEAFFGPNETRIPLEGAFAIGKATGDLTSERALVQISALSTVLPSGQTFEQKGNLGYLTDVGGQLGLKGVVIRNTGSQLALSFMSGFMGGASQALADSQVTTVTGEFGQTSRNVTGNTTKNAAFQGLATSATKLSEYYNKQLENIVPAIKVDSGIDVYFIVLEGVKINGLTTSSNNSFNYLD